LGASVQNFLSWVDVLIFMSFYLVMRFSSEADKGTPAQNMTSSVHLKWQKCWELCKRMEGDCFKGDDGQ
jgi:hypothetical protein